ncbi:MAG: polygalacturonase [Chthoniobacter sp.]|jgi:polygalacturonase|nr:polygalacturonase [Chthoniobacter sp.]
MRLAIAIAFCSTWSLRSYAAETLPAAPRIPNRSFNITRFGAVSDGKTLNTLAIQKAIDQASTLGGGTVVVETGVFVSGPIELKSNIDLHLAKGATLAMSSVFDDFPITGKDHQNFITATNQHDVQISGEGTIDGRGEPWWIEFRKVKGTANTGARRPQMIRFLKCERVKLTGFTTKNPPNTHCSMAECTDVTIEGLTMAAPGDSPNTDALNLRVRNAVIRKCSIATGDDNIVFLASAPASGGGPGVENITVSDCKLGVGHGLSIGSYTSGGIRNISVENVSFDGTTSGIRMKSGRDRGGLVETITYKNITMKNVKFPIYLTSYYPKEPKSPGEDKGESAGAMTPKWHGITIEDMTATDSSNSIIIWGLPEEPMSNIALKHVNITATKGALVYHAKDIHFSNVQLHVTGAPLSTFNAEVEGMTTTPFDSVDSRK